MEDITDVVAERRILITELLKHNHIMEAGYTEKCGTITVSGFDFGGAQVECD